ncbi:hypothetical protein [Mucilaginibacter terrenus]|nr:hypothetical protein [Mucilaginibacter terrenus]
METIRKGLETLPNDGQSTTVANLAGFKQFIIDTAKIPMQIKS